jgi:hypothetical protein
MLEMDEMIAQEDLRPVLGANIARLRRDKDLTQQDLADRLGVSRVMLNRVETGKSSPGSELLYSIADALGVPTDFLRQVPLDVKYTIFYIARRWD